MPGQVLLHGFLDGGATASVAVYGESGSLAVPDAYRTVPFDPAAGPVANVAALYREIAPAFTGGRPASPDFHAAARHHRVLAAIERAAESGGTEPVS